MSLSPLATLLNPHPCTLLSCLIDSAVRSSVCPRRVTCDNRSVAVDPNLHMAELYIEFATGVGQGLKVISLLRTGAGSVNKSTAAKETVLRDAELG